jgi:hypothetical protein
LAAGSSSSFSLLLIYKLNSVRGITYATVVMYSNGIGEDSLFRLVVVVVVVVVDAQES